MDKQLGQGSYGSVVARDGKAVKQFGKLSHLIQEYMALKYLSDCKYVVHAKGVDFDNLELHMELYDGSLRKWLEIKDRNGGPSQEENMIILRDILLGLVELHDRNLAHGDLKPSNILVMNKPLRAVLGDCGFVSIKQYAKVDRTAEPYRDPEVSHDTSHDMFSFGICFLEIVAGVRINRQASYQELKAVVHEYVRSSENKKIIYNLLHEEKTRRPSARFLLYRLFKESPTKWIKPKVTPDNGGKMLMSISSDEKKFIRKLMKDTAYICEIHRSKKGYGALISYLDAHRINSSLYKIHAAVTLMILSAIFGVSGFRENEVMSLCKYKYDLEFIHNTLNKMLSDRHFINMLLTP